nr:hypothetical protein BaRGS_025794 [Batillaria attramentaria]
MVRGGDHRKRETAAVRCRKTSRLMQKTDKRLLVSRSRWRFREPVVVLAVVAYPVVIARGFFADGGRRKARVLPVGGAKSTRLS